MRDFDSLTHHPAIQGITDILCDKTQNKDRGFFQVEAAYFLAKMASSMRAVIKTKDRGEIPTNIYALAFATSGFGKGHSVSIMETQLLKGFRKRFMEHTFNVLSDRHLDVLAMDRAAYKGTEEADELVKLEKEFNACGAYPFTFDSGTTPAVKQLRSKLLLASCGSINLQIDEVGSNLLNNVEILNTFLELYDVGKTKQKLIKNTVDSTRGQEVEGGTPANLMLFGTPSKLLDGGSTEEQFFDFLETGYARRCIFAWGTKVPAAESQTAQEIYAKLTSNAGSMAVSKLANKFTRLADEKKFKWSMDLQDDVAIELLEYRILCEAEAEKLPEHQEIQKAELGHRYFKALKLAGILAFVDESPIVSMDNLYHAIHLVQQSGVDFAKLMNREKTYEKLARYIAANDEELTHADLYEALPFYKAGNAARNEIMTLATAWGHKNNIIIKKTFSEGSIEFFSGDTLAETSMDEMIFSCSQDFAAGYEPLRQPFSQLHLMTGEPGFHWCNHYFEGEHRRGDNVIEGFNMVVLDIDGTASRDLVHEMLQDYTFMSYTTKRHTVESNRFRIVMPISYELNLDKEDYGQFMNNIMDWLPFHIDEEANQRERKWQSNAGNHHYNLRGALLDPIRFVPKTSRNLQHQNKMTELKDLDTLERWFAERMAMGNRNNQMIKFALALADGGMQYPEIETRVMNFNNKMANNLPESELQNTILKTVAKRLSP